MTTADMLDSRLSGILAQMNAMESRLDARLTAIDSRLNARINTLTNGVIMLAVAVISAVAAGLAFVFG